MMTPREVVSNWYQDDELLIFGHRGASAYAPMNTLPAFELAAEQGAHGVELDVHLTQDRELIIVHDFTIDHTTDGTGTVTDKTLAELKEYDAGSWFDARFAGEKLPTLDEVFETVGDKLYINVEIKSLAREGDGTEDAVADCIRRHNMGERVIVSSFNPYVLKRFRPIAPEIPLGYLLHPNSLTSESHTILPPTEYEALHLYYDMIDQQQLEFAETHQHIINTWTVNETELALRLASQGVRGIITDKPDIMKQAWS